SANLANGLVDVAVHYDQVQVTIQVQIDKRAAETETVARWLADARANTHVFVCASAGSLIESHHLVIEIGNRNRRSARVVEIGGIHAHAGARLAVFVERDAG